MYKRQSLLDGEVVDEVAGLEVVGGVQNNIDRGDVDCGRVGAGGCEQLGDIAGDKVGDVRMDGDARVEAGDVAARGFGFGQSFARVGLVEEDLALQVRGLDEVAVDEGECANPRAREQRCRGRTSGAAANDGDMGRGQPLLARGACLLYTSRCV